MRILIAGANGQIGQHLVRKMASSGHVPVALVREAHQFPAMLQLGAAPVLGNLEEDCTELLKDCHGVIFTAGSGPKTGPEKTVDVDQNAAIRMVDAAERAGLERFIMVSSMRADEPEKGPEKLQHYLKAKKAADDHLRASSLRYTIVRPGKLSNEPQLGKLAAAERLNEFGEISREDVAETLLQTVDASNTFRHGFDVINGDTPIDQALLALNFAE